MSTTSKANASLACKVDDKVSKIEAFAKKLLEAGDADHAIAMMGDALRQVMRDNELLTARLRLAQRLRFGRKSEKLTAEELGQLVLSLGGTQEEAQKEQPQVPVPNIEAEAENATETGNGDKKSTKKSSHRGRKPVNQDLRREIKTINVPEEERTCIHCHAEMAQIGFVDGNEYVEYVPAHFIVHVTRKEKLACKKCNQDIVTATAPESSSATANMVDTGVSNHMRAGISVLAHLLEAKCKDAMPIHRICNQFARLGFDVPATTMYGYWKAAAKMIWPVAQVVMSEVLSHDIVGVDDTKLTWLNPDKNSEQKRGHLWCLVGNNGLVAFEFTKTWEAQEVAQWLTLIDGHIQCDDYRGYRSEVVDVDGNACVLVPADRRLGCWMHLRRHFRVAFDSGQKSALPALDFIKTIYSIEADAKSKGLSSEEIGVLRQQKSMPVANALFAWMAEQAPRTLPRSYLGKAIKYAEQQKEFVMRCLSDGRFELDTGRVERQIRTPVIGRKNYLFTGSAECAQLLAGVYTLICSCSNLQIPIQDYLIDIMTKLRDGFPLRHINSLRPDVWAANREVSAPLASPA